MGIFVDDSEVRVYILKFPGGTWTREDRTVLYCVSTESPRDMMVIPGKPEFLVMVGEWKEAHIRSGLGKGYETVEIHIHTLDEAKSGYDKLFW
ncbi:MAG: hypothetical protein WC477_02975 [Patescibacteria group bacterium]